MLQMQNGAQLSALGGGPLQTYPQQQVIYGAPPQQGYPPQQQMVDGPPLQQGYYGAPPQVQQNVDGAPPEVPSRVRFNFGRARMRARMLAWCGFEMQIFQCTTSV